MAYQSDTVATIVNRLNTRYLLPSIQREFVWKPDQVLSLFDSILQGLPISSFLFWELKEENRDKWETYSFVQDYTQEGTHNRVANTDGIQQLTLIVDGQQRLTSFLIGLKGSYTLRQKHGRRDNPDAYKKQKLYLNLLHDPRLSDDDEDDEVGIRYGLRFAESQPKNQVGEHWIKVGRILNCDSQEKFDELLAAEEEAMDSTLRSDVKLLQRNLEALYRAIWKDQGIAYYTEHNQDHDRVLKIFIRANEGGTKLSKSDLLMSMVISKWDRVNARTEILSCGDTMASRLYSSGKIDKDLVMKASLVLCGLPVQYRVKNFTAQNLTLIQDQWRDIKAALFNCADLVRSFGITGPALTSTNALIPTAYYLFKHKGESLRGTTQFDIRNASAIRRWLILMLLQGVFGRASDGLLHEIRAIIDSQSEVSDDFPATEIIAQLSASGKMVPLSEASIENLLAKSYKRPETFLALSLLYDENGWGMITHHVDHIFPSGLFDKTKMADRGLVEKWHDFFDQKDRLANLQLLLDHENTGKSDDTFEKWLQKRDDGYKSKHLIPEDTELYRFESFVEFLKSREDLIRARYRQVLNL
ncbi:MAG: DUF262 domain-containing protein [Fimbriimonadales bacterium]